MSAGKNKTGYGFFGFENIFYKLLISLLIFSLIFCLISAVNAASWTDITPAESPGFAHHSMTYDSFNQKIVLAGYDFGSNYRTWIYDGAAWSNPINITISGGGDPEVAYDKNRKVVVLYTGTETWEYNVTTGVWVNKTSPANLPVNCGDGALLQYDSVRNKTVLVATSDNLGGGDNTTTETWLWDGATWTNVTGAQPPNAALGGMAFDGECEEMVLITMGNMETWTFDGAAWTQRFPANSPSPPLGFIGMAYDPVRKVSVFFGGETPAPAYPTSTWEWNGSNWINSSAAPPYPSGNIDYAISYFAPKNGIIMHGGWGPTGWEQRNSMWLYGGAVSCGCIGENYTFVCGQTVNESCNLTCNLNSNGTCFAIGENNIIINGAGYSITGNTTGIGINATGINNVTIKNFNIYNFSTFFSAGIYLENSDNGNITNNNVTLNWRGVVLLNSGNNTLKRNNIYNNLWDGINIWDSSTGNNLINNKIHNNSGDGGLVMNGNPANGIPAENTISSNNITGNNDGIIFWGGCYSVVGCVNGGDNNKVINNNISNNNGTGVNMYCDDTGTGACASNASIFNFNYNNNISGNIITNNINGIVLNYSNSTDIYNNIICGNTVADIDNATSDADAEGDNNTCNITDNWNDTSASSGCKTRCGFTPCLGEGEEGYVVPGALPCCAGLTSVPGCYGDNCTTPCTGSYKCINCGDGFCNTTAGESYCNCPADCPAPICGCIGATQNFTCADVVNESCTMNCNLNSNGTCFTVGVNNIVIDGNGFSITGDTTGNGIYANGRNNVTIKNFKIYNFSYGIYIKLSSNNTLGNNTANLNTKRGFAFYKSNYNTLENNTANGNSLRGFNFDESSYNKITNNTACNNQAGFFSATSNNNTFKDNLACDNSFSGFALTSSTGSILTSNTAYNNSFHGFSLASSSNLNTLTNNTAHNNSYGIRIFQSDRNIVNGNFLYENLNGTYIGNSRYNQLANNTVNSNSDNGIYLEYSSNSTIANNTANSNNDGIYLYNSSNNTLTNNTANSNSEYGIYLYSSSNNTLTSNTANNNNRGIYLHSSPSNHNTLTSNTANNNSYNGIYLGYSLNNTLIYNTANSNTIGISLWTSSNNTLTNNTANDNTWDGIRLSYSDFNDLINNNMRNNTNNGVYFHSTANNNTLTGNYICGNGLDINDTDANSGDENTCNTTSNWNDTSATSGGCMYSCSAAPTPGSIIITEIMINPGAVTDANGEYVELYNTGTGTYNLQGLILKDNGTDSHTISSSLIITPGNYIVLCRNSNSSENGNFTCDYDCSSFVLTNSGDEVILEMQNGTVIDEVWYNDTDWSVAKHIRRW